MKKLYMLVFVLSSILLVGIQSVNAYVSVKGYYRSNGTYVAPYVRSNPNGLKYDNYGYKPSQGLYNSSYGTKGTDWDTPTYITDPDYYEGKAIYDSTHGLSAGSSAGNQNSAKGKIPANASANYFGNDWSCNSGYKIKYDAGFSKIGCEKIIVPLHAKLSYSGSDWYCNSGYKTTYDTSFNKVGCDKIVIPLHASLDYLGSDWNCDSGYKIKYNNTFDKIGCEKIKIPAHASLDYFGNNWNCNSGYKVQYNDSFEKIGCRK